MPMLGVKSGKNISLMSFEIFITKAAQTDLDEIFFWYEQQLNNLGMEFIYEFERTLEKIVRNPFYASCIETDARGASLKKFPYQIVYRLDEKLTQVRIIAIIHHHRDPEGLRQRLL